MHVQVQGVMSENIRLALEKGEKVDQLEDASSRCLRACMSYYISCMCVVCVCVCVLCVCVCMWLWIVQVCVCMCGVGYSDVYACILYAICIILWHCTVYLGTCTPQALCIVYKLLYIWYYS